MNEIKQETNKYNENRDLQGVQTNQYQPLEDEREYISNIPQSAAPRKDDKASPFTKRIKWGAGVLMIAAIAAVVIFGMSDTHKSVDTSAEAKEAIKTHMSTTLAAGTKLMSKDDNYMGEDLTITHNSADDDTTIWVWDYAAEDGDYVQIIIDGTPIGDPFMIKNKPVSFKVPAEGEIQVLGTKDGGGGITYGVYYELNQTTYFNGMKQGGSNIYTLIRE